MVNLKFSYVSFNGKCWIEVLRGDEKIGEMGTMVDTTPCFFPDPLLTGHITLDEMREIVEYMEDVYE